MFNPKPDNDPKPFPQPEANEQEATSPRAATSPLAPAATAAAGISVIGTDLTILGDKVTIISQSKLQIDGQIRGNVHGRVVLINEGGSVTGEIWAERIDVSGAVHGPIVAVNIALHDSARVEGDIMYQKISISEGAEVDGRARLIKNARDLMPMLDAAAIARGKANPYRT
jgi:cytoskeletal protein CcmA (bactofilin family)